jgi:hypothetical protein
MMEFMSFSVFCGVCDLEITRIEYFMQFELFHAEFFKDIKLYS